MASLLHSESRRLYSWWWDSHISPKNSKWLQQNLTDMDAKVKTMIKLIEEDADSFAKRAEMYYKKRPELMKLVEEFYRAYRALAERYDHATGELRQVHRTMAEAFPNQIPFILAEDSPSQSSEPHTPELPHPIRSFLDPDDLHKDVLGLSASDMHALRKSGPYSGGSDNEVRKRGLKQLHDMFEAGTMEPQNSNSAEGGARKGLIHEIEEKAKGLHNEISQLSNENHNLKAKLHSESVRAGEAESELQNLKEAIANTEGEKESVLLQYQQCLEKLSHLERELSRAQEASVKLSDKASRAETEVQTLKEAITSVEAEKDAGMIKHEESLQRISYLEVMAAQAQETVEGLSERAIRAENESEYLKTEISRLESEKEAGLHQYNQCILKISDLEKMLSVAEENVRLYREQAESAETEVLKLKALLSALNEEKDASALQYKNCLEKIAKLEMELACAQENVKRLNGEVLMGAAKLENAEQKCVLLEISNQSLRLEADNLAKKIAMKDQQLSVKQEELEGLQTRVQDERLRHAQIEATFHTLENLHSQSQEEQRALANELKSGLQMLKDLETCKHSLEDELRRVKDENHCLNEQKLSSDNSMDNLQHEICSLREMKERLEEEVSQQIGQSNALQKEIFSVTEEIKGLNSSYKSLVAQVESVGLKPDQIGSSVKNLLDENSNLRQICEKNSSEKEALCKKLENMGDLLQKNALLESSISTVNLELEHTHEKVRALQESIQFLNGEKSSLVAEKAALLSQLQILTENMQKLLEKNAALENSLSGARVELEGLREKSKGLDEICQLLKNEKTNLLAERSSLAIQLENVERRLEHLERRFTGLEEKYSGLEKEKESSRSQVEELRISLALEKQERTSFALQSATQFARLENHIHQLQEENKWRKKEFEEELDKAVKAQFEICIMQKFIKDMEEKNYTLLVECQKHVEASKLAEKLISELESENLEQQVEAELLLDEIEKLRLDIYRIFKVLETGPDSVFKDKIENEQTFVHNILENIEGMKCCLSEYEENNQQLLVENSVLLTLLGQLKLEGVEVDSQKAFFEQELKSMTEKLVMVQNDKHELLVMNRQLNLAVSKGDQQASLLESELKNLSAKQGDLQEAYIELQKQYMQVLEENRSLLKKFSDIVEVKGMLEQENDALLQETLALLNLSMVFKNSLTERTTELKLLSEDLQTQEDVNIDLKKEISLLAKMLEMKEAENKVLKDSVQRMEMELQGFRESNEHLKHQISTREDTLRGREAELLEAEKRLEAADILTTTLSKTVDELKIEYQESKEMKGKLEKQIVQLSEHTISQDKEIESLCEVNSNLVSEVGKLREEIQEQIIRGEDLSSKLDEKNNESEIWEAEASTFYFDLQISSIREVLYENKVHELSGVCEILEDKSASNTLEIEQMEEKINSMESEIAGLKSQLAEYGPVIASLRDDVASLERNAFIQIKNDASENQEDKSAEAAVHQEGSGFTKVVEGHSHIPHGIQDLQRLQTRIKAVENFVRQMRQHGLKATSKRHKQGPEALTREIEELQSYSTLTWVNSKHKGKSGLQNELSDNIKSKQGPEAPSSEIEELKSYSCLSRVNSKSKEKSGLQNDLRENIKSQKAKLRASDVRDGIQMKDIPLDEVSDRSLYKIRRRNNLEAGGSNDPMLELWETSEDFNLGRTVNAFSNPIHKPVEEKKVYDQLEKFKRRSRRPSAELEIEKELGVDKLAISTDLTGPSQEVTNRKILERLASDAEKLVSLQITVQNLSRKLETNKKRRKSRDIDFETVKEQLLEVEETVLQLADLNGQLMRTTEEGSPCSSRKTSGELEDALSIRQKRISEQARKGSEKIGRLQLEVQKIQYVLLKLEEEKKNKGKTRFLRNKTSIILRDFIYSGKRGSRRKKAHLCGCFKPPSSRDGQRMSYS